MRLRVLGSSISELPKVSLSSFLIDEKLLFDAGVILSALKDNELFNIKHIFITHAHLDHIKDLPFFAEHILLNGRRHQITVMSIPPVLQSLKDNIFNDTVWPDFTRIPTCRNPIIRLKKIYTEKTVRIDGYKITARSLTHTVPAVSYMVENSNRKRLLYIGDTGPTKTIWKSLDSAKINALIIEVSFPDRYKNLALKTGHLTPKLLQLELNKMKRLPDAVYISHCKPAYKNEIEEELKNLKIGNVKLLRDGITYEV